MTTDTHAADTAADQALKARHRAMWALGDYPAVARELIAELGDVLVTAAGVKAGQHVLDVAAGSGNASIPAARLGADVVATDLCPDLLRAGEKLAVEEGLSLTWRECDAENMPCATGEYDATFSCVGVMFAPHHQAAANELVRVTKPGGTIAVLSWTPEGFIGQMFTTMKPYAPPPPPGASPPPLWGKGDYVRGLFGAGVSDVNTEMRTLRVANFANGAEFRDFFKATYGPTIAVYAAIADDPAKVAALDADLAALGDRGLIDGVMEWEYLLLTATKA